MGQRRPEDEEDLAILIPYWQRHTWTVAQELLCPWCNGTIQLQTLCPLYEGVIPKKRAMSTEILSTGSCACAWTLAQLRELIDVSNNLLDRMFDELAGGLGVGSGQVWSAKVEDGKLVDVRRIDQMMGEHDGEE